MRSEGKLSPSEDALIECDARGKICLYFLTVCTGAFTFLAGAIFYKQADLFDYRVHITCLIICIILTVVSSLLTIKLQYQLLLTNRMHDYLTTILRFSFSFRFKEFYYLDGIRKPCSTPSTYQVYFTFATRTFITSTALFLWVLFSLLFTEPTKQKITEQPTTTATQAKTSYHIQVIPKNCGQPSLLNLATVNPFIPKLHTKNN